ncbi:MAG: transcriptional repressor [Deltaproteobacteria bacterium]|nr:transcriptional repressor [Deltaproteobacteria bacterium]
MREEIVDGELHEADGRELDDATVAELHERLEKYMEKNGLRSTSQRRLVSEAFFRSTGHLSIEDLLATVREEDSKIGYATVYRTLKLLKDCGLAYERHFGDGVSRYEVALEDEHHDHLICMSCGKIVEFENDEIEQLQDDLAAKHGFVLKRHVHELYGLCGDCRTD